MTHENAAIKDLLERVERLEIEVAALLPEEPDPLETAHAAFLAGPVAEARAREELARSYERSE